MRNRSDFDKLRKACEPLVKYLNEYHDPHTYVVVSQDGIKLQKVEMGIHLDPVD